MPENPIHATMVSVTTMMEFPFFAPKPTFWRASTFEKHSFGFFITE